MASGNQEYEKMYIGAILLALVVLAGNVYYYCHPLLQVAGLTVGGLDYLMGSLHRSGLFSSPLKTKIPALLLLGISAVVRSGKGRKIEPWILLSVGALGAVLYLFPFSDPRVYLVATIVGTAALVWTLAMAGRLFAAFHEHVNDLKESFEQEAEPHPGPLSIVLETKYYYHKAWHRGFITVENPFRGTLILGSAGSGKSFSVFNPFIEQMISKGYTMMLYDFKMPDLTRTVYNALLRNRDKYPRAPHFYCINFQDPLRSNRCNPIAPEYLTDIIDASETARVVMEALNKGNEKKDFFWMSAQQYIGICLWLLRIYTPPGGKEGDWCDFPHLIELINQDYSKVLDIVKRQRTLDGKARVFVDALEANAQDQLQGQIASARIPLNDIASPALYWVLSGNDFSLDINDPEDPKVLCIGNDPKRQEVYGAALSLFTFRVIKRVNQKGKLPCGVVIDELPTISVQGLDGLMATARSNRVAVVLGIQDLTQVKADYGDKVANKIISLPANVFVGASSIETAEKYSKEFGREFRRQESQTRSVDSESLNISYHEEEVMPVKKITTLPQGTFIGKVAVENGSPIRQPFFCGAIQIDMEEYRRKEAQAEDIPVLTDFETEKALKELRDPAVMRVYLLDHMRKEITDSLAASGRRMGEEELSMEAEKRVTALSEQACEDLLREMEPQIEAETINAIIERKYDDIRADIEMLIASESVRVSEGGAGEGDDESLSNDLHHESRKTDRP